MYVLVHPDILPFLREAFIYTHICKKEFPLTEKYVYESTTVESIVSIYSTYLCLFGFFLQLIGVKYLKNKKWSVKHWFDLNDNSKYKSDLNDFMKFYVKRIVPEEIESLLILLFQIKK
ncbi:hypothetical protein RFI_35203 [Reticulomyxa filosa]|uniref:Uncharacterized protein n=1 Tax=Reticulomyxa filosa TaxID=46433 RepID=X6LJU0_RETFI|nr:hypothetical protein RFI_35203 [Reticulomyxa filosa]|eukprot:ETO02233.1 hypothetical protein RFI_35203 [Reticulomyxa filosa]